MINNEFLLTGSVVQRIVGALLRNVELLSSPAGKCSRGFIFSSCVVVTVDRGVKHFPSRMALNSFSWWPHFIHGPG